MKHALFLAAFAVAASTAPAVARDNGFGAALLGGVVGGAIGGAISRPAPPPVFLPPPPAFYVAPPPVIYERRVYVAPPPVYVAPAQRIVSHPWPGPAFACYDPEPNAANRTICASQDLSEASLMLAQAVQADIQQTGYNAGPIRAEYAGFMQSVRAACAPYAIQQQGDCIGGMLAHERDTVTNRLTGVYAVEAARPIGVQIELQQRLHAMGLLAGGADGIYGEGTRRAISMWQGRQGHEPTGVLSDEDVAELIPSYPAATVPAYVPARPAPAPAPTQAAAPPAQPSSATIQQASAVIAVPPAAPQEAADPLAGLHEGAPYALARGKLFAAGWQTQFFKTDTLSDADRETRQWFIDHHINEVEDCSSSGCKMQLHNADGRLLYVYTQVGSHASDAYRGAGPSVIAFCLDRDDITCSAPPAPSVPGAQQAAR